MQQSRDNKDLEGITTGKLIDILQNSLEFDKKEDFIQASFGLSQIRNRLAHELARSVKLERIEQSATKYRENYKELRGLFDIVHDVFCLFYKDEKKDDKWDFILEEYIGMLNADEDAKEIEVS